LKVSDLASEILQTAFRLFPWSTEPGLRRIGDPGSASPVLLTGNFDLGVRRVQRALRGCDAWLVVAPSSGINVWCAAAGGHLTTHQIVTALKTCGIEEQVSHRRAILPQLAATGVEGREVSRRSGWKVRFGPVYAEDLPRYFAQGGEKSDDMRHVRFGLAERLQMAVVWAAPAALLTGLLALPFRPGWAGPLALLSTLLAFAVFLLYDRIPGPRRVLLASAAALISLACVALAGGGLGALVTALFASTVLAGVLTYDYTGSTPTAGGAHFEERNWHITLDRERCQGVFSCWEVCPEACYDKDVAARKARLAYEDRCIRCGACVVQCPMDALAFEDADGRRIEPEQIRRFKLNLLGQRKVESGVREHPEESRP